MSRALRPPKRTPRPLPSVRRDAPPPPAWPSFTGSSTFVGASPDGRVTVYVDASLGAEATQNAMDLLADAPRILAFNDATFALPGGSVSALVFALNGPTDGTGGADHMGCDYVSGNAIEVDASFGNSARVSALFEAELSECSMGGNLCGVSTGEALSRWCAMAVSNNALSDFATAPIWAADGMPNWVDATEPTDGGADSTGCGMAFLSWLQAQGFTLPAIAQSMAAAGDSGTLAGLYEALTGDVAQNAWPNFQAAVSALPFGIVSDDPFAGVPAPAPGPPPVPPPAPGPPPVPPPGPVPPPCPPPGPAPAPPSVTLDEAIAWATEGLTLNWPT
jgi:hypothetical protein